MFDAWNLDFYKPIFTYGDDSLFHLFIVKSIIDGGWFFSNDFVGLPHIAGKFYMHDFAIHGDSFNLALIKLLSCFTSDVFLVVNSYFLLTFLLISTSAYCVARSLKMSHFCALLISILFAFMPYHLYKNVWHLFLSNYMVIPFTILISLWIMEDKLQIVKVSKEGKFCLSPNRYFYLAVLLIVFIATSGVYYALYSAMIFTFSWVIYSVRKGVFINHHLFSFCILGSLIVAGLVLLHMPALIYWAQNGINNSVGGRHVGGSNVFGLNISNLFMPAENHYWDFLAEVRGRFDSYSTERETRSEPLGILGASGFLFLLLWFLFRGIALGKSRIIDKTIKRLGLNNRDQEFISNLSSLNIFIVLYATVGGFIIFVAMAFPALRSHARFSIFLAFISLLLIGFIFDKIILKKGKIAKIAIVIVCILALFDQVGRVSGPSVQDGEMIYKFNSDRDFVATLEKENEGAKILILPIFGFPEYREDNYSSLIGYIHSKNLFWSYPVMEGRASHKWLENLSHSNWDIFLESLKDQGFELIVINEMQIVDGLKIDTNKMVKMKEMKENVKNNLKLNRFSRDGRFSAYDVR
ncbi:MAG: hypothetical protein ISQ34_03555 [Rickettsiales bacterium]|nr:hypothetical protein [Rickettsiales bacterium]